MNRLMILLAALVAGSVALGADAEQAGDPGRPRVRQMDQPVEKPLDGGRAGRRRPANLGVVTGPVTEELREHVDLPDNAGLLITRVELGGPAARVGLRANDILLTFDGVDVASPIDLAGMVDAAGPGTRVVLGLVRRGKPQEVAVVLGARRERPGVGGGQGRDNAAAEHRLLVPGLQANAENLSAQALARARAATTGGGKAASSVEVRSSIINGVADIRAVSRDGEGTVEITSRGDRTTVTILGPDGDEIHAGPLDEPADFEAVPEEWRDKVEALHDRATSGAAAPVPPGGV